MKIIVYYPQNIETQEQLQVRVASVHAQIAASYIRQLNCPKENKAALLKDIREACVAHKQ